MAAEGGPALGLRFSLAYAERGKPVQDSPRARMRLANAVFAQGHPAALRDAMRSKLGVQPPLDVYQSYFEEWFAKASLSDILDTITLEAELIGQDRYASARTLVAYIADVDAIFSETNLGYRCDARGGVRFYTDEEFERSRSSLIAGLGDTRFSAAKVLFEEAHAALSGAQPDTLTSVLRASAAVENVFKVITGEPRIGASELKRKLAPLLEGTYSGRDLNSARRLMDSFAEWVNAGHQFRHAPGEAAGEPPPLSLALTLLSAAAGYLRWLVSLSPSG